MCVFIGSGVVILIIDYICTFVLEYKSRKKAERTLRIMGSRNAVLNKNAFVKIRKFNIKEKKYFDEIQEVTTS